jgi:inositol-phosphate phosphatase/L-galactose 1-phosphate phosphatase/histidinol-phosphatase
MSQADAAEFLAFAGRLAEAAAAVVGPYFQRPIGVDFKAVNSPVTEADLAVETRLRELIADAYPDHGVIGEELASERTDAEHVWVVDPIDGTRSFINGIPMFTTLIALVRDSAPLIGVIDQPTLGHRWAGGGGVATTFNGAAARVRPCKSLDEAVICTSAPVYYTGDAIAPFERLRDAVHWVQYGSDAYGFGQVASGFMDLGVESGMGVHDYCALAPVIESAGGLMTDWLGAPLTVHSGDQVLAAGDPAVHAAALALLAG